MTNGIDREWICFGCVQLCKAHSGPLVAGDVTTRAAKMAKVPTDAVACSPDAFGCQADISRIEPLRASRQYCAALNRKTM